MTHVVDTLSLVVVVEDLGDLPPHRRCPGEWALLLIVLRHVLLELLLVQDRASAMLDRQVLLQPSVFGSSSALASGIGMFVPLVSTSAGASG